jgi:HlyD family secretion protein
VTKNLDQTSKFKKFRTAGLVLAWTAVVSLPLAGIGCGHKEATKEKVEAVEVGTTSPVRKNLTREVQQPGFLRPYEQTPIYTKIAGFAEEPNYDIGDHVKKGELLVDLYVPEVKQDLKVKKARVKQAAADLKQSVQASLAAEAAKKAAEADVDAKQAAIKSAEALVRRWQAEDERAQLLVAKGVYDQQTAEEMRKELRSSEALWDEAKAKYFSAKANYQRASAYFEKTKADIEVADAGVDVAQASYDQWKDWLSYAQITAPFDGVVTLRNVHKGHFLQPSNSGSTSKAAEPLFVMMRTDIMRCVVDVPELDAVLVNDNDKAIIHFDAMPGVETIGKVSRNAGTLDDRNRTLRVEVWLEPKGATIKYTVSPKGVITHVDPIPPKGGEGYPRSATFQLLVAGGKGIVDATTNAAGAIVGYALHSGGKEKDYKVGPHEGDTICEVFRPYMYAHVTILGTVKNAWSLPAEAVTSDILSNQNRSYCFMVEKGKAYKTFLQVRARCNEGLEILRKKREGQSDWQDITGDEVVATTNTKALQNGQDVRIKSTEAPETQAKASEAP